MSRKFDVAVVGATGLVGETMIRTLEERSFPVVKLYPLASSRSAGRTVTFRDEAIPVGVLDEFDFGQVQIALFSAGGSVSAEFAPRAASAGAVAIDNTSYFRMHDDVPLVVPEVNADRVADYANRGIIANPNCSTIQLVVALKPIHDAVGIERINVATYQAISGAGRAALEDMNEDAERIVAGGDPVARGAAKHVAFNAVPQIGDFQANGFTTEEMKLVFETRKILEAPDIRVNPTAVRIPVLYGHCEAVNIETREKLTAPDARALLQDAPGVSVIDGHELGGYPTPATDAAHRDPVFVGRLREDPSHPKGLDLWIVADNIRKGAALNSVQIAEILASRFLTKVAPRAVAAATSN